jgi:beta-phosphoglucomutase
LHKFGKLKAVIWDMDGVIVDSKMCHFKAWKKILEKHGWDFSEESFAKTFGMTNEQVILDVTAGSVDRDTSLLIADEKDAYFREIVVKEADFVKGVPAWLQTFKRSGIKQAVASSGSWDNINTILNALQIRSSFDALVSGEDSASKPDPAVFLLAAEDLEIAPRHCLVVEDAIAGVGAAVAAGMKCLALTTTNPASRLSQADLILPDLLSLTTEMLQKMFA